MLQVHPLTRGMVRVKRSALFAILILLVVGGVVSANSPTKRNASLPTSLPSPSPTPAPTSEASHSTPQHVSLADPNWFYSSVLQASSALVAIFGGFLLTYGIALQRGYSDRYSKMLSSDDSLAELTRELRMSIERKYMNNAKMKNLTEKVMRNAGERESERYEEIRAKKIIGRGIIIISFLAIFGIVLPLILLPADPTSSQHLYELIISAGFIVGLTWALLFLCAVAFAMPLRLPGERRSLLFRFYDFVTGLHTVEKFPSSEMEKLEKIVKLLENEDEN